VGSSEPVREGTVPEPTASEGPLDHETLATEVAASVFAGFALLALVNGVAIAVAVPLPAMGISLRVAHHVFDAAETLGLGAFAGGLAGAFVRFVRVPARVLQAALFAVAALVVYVVIGEYLGLQAAHGRGARFAPVVLANFVALLASAFAMTPTLAAYFAGRPRLRFVPLITGAALLVADQVPLRDDYFGIHGLVAVGAALLAGPALAPRVVSLVRSLARTRKGRAFLGAFGLFALFGLVVPPSNAVRFELFRQPCAVAPWVLATSLWRAPGLHAPVTLPESPWRLDRSGAPPVPFTTPPPLPRAPVVVLITIDALRADVVDPDTYDARFPTFASLKRDGVMFTNASSAGTQTPLSISTMLTGLYFSQQRWEDYGEGADRYPYPATDPSPRVPELLSAHGVATTQDAGFVFLANDFGVARGFQEQKLFGATKSAARASVLVRAMLERLRRADDGPLFLYSHFAEPHAPYWMGKGTTPFEHYLNAVAEADTEVGHVLAFLEEHFGDRWVLVVSADHGEAFGDHETYEHAKSLYEELLHVPLIVRSPRFPPRRVEERVGLVDLGPTLLDLFQVGTPATFNGQSLVPLLVGRKVAFTRPLLAEGRLRTALTQQDGFKVIEDPRRKVVEAYDLAVDPRETRNVFDTEPGRADVALATMRAFFAARTLRDGGYRPPYKP
jgi:arylsulfatase A-like enzyme